MEWTPETARTIVAALRERVRSVAIRQGDRVVEHVGENWISWRSRKRNRVFAEIRPLHGRVQVFILPGPRELRHSGGLAHLAPRTQGWGWFRSRLEVSSLSRVEPAARLIVQSYQHVVRPGNGSRRAQAPRRKQGL
jgi:hypothetical protein